MQAVEKYLTKVPEPDRAELERVRQAVKAACPDAEEVITYAMPGFKYRGKYLIAYAAFKDHLSVFPGAQAIETLGEKLKGFTISKGTVQFTLDRPLPDQLITQLVQSRMHDIDAA